MDGITKGADNRWQRFKKRHDAAESNSSGADIPHIIISYFIVRHIVNQLGAGWNHRGKAVAEKSNQWDKHEIGQHAAGYHNACDMRPDDITNAQQLRRNLRTYRA